MAGSAEGPSRHRGKIWPRQSVGAEPVCRYVRRRPNTSEHNTESPRKRVISSRCPPAGIVNTSAWQTHCTPSGCSTQQVVAKAKLSNAPICPMKLSTDRSTASTSCTTNDIAEAQPSPSERGVAIAFSGRLKGDCFGCMSMHVSSTLACTLENMGAQIYGPISPPRKGRPTGWNAESLYACHQVGNDSRGNQCCPRPKAEDLPPSIAASMQELSIRQ